jgi:hypothetical protein
VQQFIKRFGGFVLVFLATSVLAGRTYERLFMRHSKIFVQESSLRSVASDVNTLFVGDSHVGAGIDPKAFRRGFNLAYDGENFVGSYLKLKQVFDDPSMRSSIRTVVCGVDPNQFSSYKAGPPKRNFLVWRRYFTIPDVFARFEVSDSLGFAALSRFFPHYSEMKNAERFLRQSESTRKAMSSVRDGFFEKIADFGEKSTARREAEGRRRAFAHFASRTLYDPLLESNFWDLVDLCESSGVQLVLVTVPCSKEYIRPAVEECGVDFGHERLRPGLKKRTGVSFFGFSEIFMEQTSLFADSDHLNAEGAERFSRILSAAISDLPSEGLGVGFEPTGD